MDGQVAVTGVAASTPGVKGQANAARHSVRNSVATGMPFLLPAHQFRRDLELFAVCILSLLREVEVLAEKFDRVHVELSREVIQSAHRKDRSLWMVRRTPGSAGTDVVANGCVFLALIRNAEDVRNGRHTATTGAACSPGIGLP